MAKRLEHVLEWGFAQDFQILVEIYLYFLNSISCWAEKPKWNEMKENIRVEDRGQTAN
jgi:hypothetical protein